MRAMRVTTSWSSRPLSRAQPAPRARGLHRLAAQPRGARLDRGRFSRAVDRRRDLQPVPPRLGTSVLLAEGCRRPGALRDVPRSMPYACASHCATGKGARARAGIAIRAAGRISAPGRASGGSGRGCAAARFRGAEDAARRRGPVRPVGEAHAAGVAATHRCAHLTRRRRAARRAARARTALSRRAAC